MLRGSSFQVPSCLENWQIWMKLCVVGIIINTEGMTLALFDNGMTLALFDNAIYRGSLFSNAIVAYEVKVCFLINKNAPKLKSYYETHTLFHNKILI